MYGVGISIASRLLPACLSFLSSRFSCLPHQAAGGYPAATHPEVGFGLWLTAGTGDNVGDPLPLLLLRRGTRPVGEPVICLK